LKIRGIILSLEDTNDGEDPDFENYCYIIFLHPSEIPFPIKEVFSLYNNQIFSNIEL